jgi:hypothetical protein
MLGIKAGKKPSSWINRRLAHDIHRGFPAPLRRMQVDDLMLTGFSPYYAHFGGAVCQKPSHVFLGRTLLPMQ